MIKFLILGGNLYGQMYSYGDEYLLEALAEDPCVDVKAWGRYRPGFIKGLNALDVVTRLYSNDFPDVIMVNACAFQTDDEDNKKLFDGLKELRSKSTLIFFLIDPWRFRDTFSFLSQEIKPHFWLTHSTPYTQLFNEDLKGNHGKVLVFPFFIGRRYFNMGLERSYDLAMIGRCDIEGKPLRLWQMKVMLRVFYEGPMNKIRKNTSFLDATNRVFKTPYHLNQCMTSWNSPVYPKTMKSFPSMPFRYLEASACGTISISPLDFPELNDYYYPQECYINCRKSIGEAIRQIKYLRKNPEAFLEIQQKAYKITMNNHQPKNRVAMILDLAKGKEHVDARDYYQVAIH